MFLSMFFLLIVLLCLMLYYCFLFDAYKSIAIHIKCMHSVVTCLLKKLVASYLYVYGTMQPRHSEAPVVSGREFQIPDFS